MLTTLLRPCNAGSLLIDPGPNLATQISIEPAHFVYLDFFPVIINICSTGQFEVAGGVKKGIVQLSNFDDKKRFAGGPHFGTC